MTQNPKPWALTPDEFHGFLAPNGDREDSWDMTAPEMLEDMLQCPRAAAVDLGRSADPRYAIVPVQEPGDFVVTFDGEPIGFKLGETITISGEHTKKGLGARLVLAAYDDRPWELNPTLSVTNAGAGTLRRAHRLSVEEAHARGETVPAHNLKRYGIVK